MSAFGWLFIFILLLPIIGVLGILVLNALLSPSPEALEKQRQEEQKFGERYSNYKKSSGIPESTPYISFKSISFWIWRDGDSNILCLAPRIISSKDIQFWTTNNNSRLILDNVTSELPSRIHHLNSVLKISLSAIKYFAVEGDFYRENKISGGGGGGSSITGAVIGGVIAGDTGAIIGSRKKTNEITSKVIEHDTRHTMLTYVTDSGSIRVMAFDYSGYKILNDIIPEKEYNRVQAIQTANIVEQSKTIQQQANTDMIFTNIQKLAELKESGILSQAEFEAKKSDLLSKL